MSDTAHPHVGLPGDAVENRLTLGDLENRKIASVLPLLMKWANGPQLSEPESAAILLKITQALAFVQFNVSKADGVVAMNRAELENYHSFTREMETDLVQAAVAIASAKTDLISARAIRAHRQQYDALAQVVEAHADRASSTAAVAALTTQLAALENESSTLALKMQDRKKQFRLLMHAIHELQRTMEDDVESTSPSHNEHDTTANTTAAGLESLDNPCAPANSLLSEHIAVTSAEMDVTP